MNVEWTKSYMWWSLREMLFKHGFFFPRRLGRVTRIFWEHQKLNTGCVWYVQKHQTCQWRPTTGPRKQCEKSRPKIIRSYKPCPTFRFIFGKSLKIWWKMQLIHSSWLNGLLTPRQSGLMMPFTCLLTQVPSMALRPSSLQARVSI